MSALTKFATSQLKEVELMCDGATSAERIAELTLLHVVTVRGHLRTLYAQHLIYIYDWGLDSRGLAQVKLYARRNPNVAERDAPQPALPRKLRSRRYRERVRARGPFQPHTLWNPAHIGAGP